MIGVVQPGGGDSKTKTDKDDGSHIKDFRQFVARANVDLPPKADISYAIASPLWAKSRHIQTKFQRSPRMAGLFGTFWPHPRQILRHVRKCASAFYPS